MTALDKYKQEEAEFLDRVKRLQGTETHAEKELILEVLELRVHRLRLTFKAALDSRELG